MKRTISLILALIMIFQLVPGEVLAAQLVDGGGVVTSSMSVTIRYVNETNGQSRQVSKKEHAPWLDYRFKADTTFAGGSINRVQVEPLKFSAPVDKSTGNVSVYFKNYFYSSNTGLVKAGGTTVPPNVTITVYYKANPVAVKTPPVENIEENTKSIADIAHPSKTQEQIDKEIRDYFIVASENLSNISVSLYEYYRNAGALPEIDYEEEIKKIGRLDNKTNLFEDEIDSFYKNIPKEEKDTVAGQDSQESIASKALKAVGDSFKSTYDSTHPANVKYEFEYVADNKLETDSGMTYQHLPFISAFSSLRTATLFSYTDLDESAVDARNMGSTIEGNVAFNPLYARDSTAGGDYSTRQFRKNPMTSAAFISLLSRNNVISDNYMDWKTLGQYREDGLSEEETLEIIESAINGIEIMIDEGLSRPWSAHKTFNYELEKVHPEGSDEYKTYENTYKHPSKIQGWKDSLVIIQFPSAYSWGSALMNNITGGTNFYVEVPLAPTLGYIDLKLEEVSTEPHVEDGVATGAYKSVLRYSTDLMPSIPEMLEKFAPTISLNIVDGEILYESLNDGKPYNPEYTTGQGVLTSDTKSREFTVLWRPNKDLPEEQNALLYAKINMFSQSEIDTLKPHVTGEALALVNSIEKAGVKRNLIVDNPPFTEEFYKGTFKETNFTDNVVPIVRNIPPLDLYLDNAKTNYDKAKEEFTLEATVGLTSAMRELDLAEGELPVEIEFNWDTDDGQSGSDIILLDELLKGTEEDFEFKANINFPASGALSGRYTVRVNPDPINPYEPDVLNNEISGLIRDSKFVDFGIEAHRDTYTSEEGTGGVEIRFIGALMNSTNPINSTVRIYRNGALVETQNIPFEGGVPEIIEYNIPEAQLTAGEQTYRAVINSNDYDAEKPSPFEGESDMDNNYTELTVMYVEKGEAPANTSCSFDETKGASYANEKRVCAAYGTDEDGDEYCKRREWVPVPRTYHLEIHSELTYIDPKDYSVDVKSALFSDTWHRGADRTLKTGQALVSPIEIPPAKDLNGDEFKDDLMSKLGITTLRQIIQAGSGIRAEAKIRIEGTIEKVGSSPAGELDNYVNYLQNSAMYVSGDPSITGGSVNTYNNNREMTQKMIPNGAPVYIHREVTDKEYGDETNGVGKVIEVYTLDYEIEIPMIISEATGYIDVDGGASVPVPDENKWFTYLNSMDGHQYKLAVATTIDPKKLGGSGGTSLCILNDDTLFRYAISGTIFDNVNTDDGGGDGGFWDN